MSRTFRRKTLTAVQCRPFAVVFIESRHGGTYPQIVTPERGSREYLDWYRHQHGDRPSGTNNAPAWLRRLRNRSVRAQQQQDLLRGLKTDLEAVQVRTRRRDVNWVWF